MCLETENEHGIKAARIAALLAHYPRQEQDLFIAEQVAKDYVEAVKAYPSYVVDAAAVKWLTKSPYSHRRPTVKDLVDYCYNSSFRYRQLRNFLKKLIENEF
jgi:hypothetical protein